ncbi:hypothetical protein LPB73_01050 [Tardiphaga sp. 37S4]|uniref:hypothetical protein n=1 Tax=Tardiphaga sp. 37S4 TaxID=1404741 RepID=UPI001E3B50EB|nr:hypothetical protein [Tardiphaga sp. 37S4]UFS76039.1 hypothetical protein LPB73_01050 [Tardiphaga sp. 37S4]
MEHLERYLDGIIEPTVNDFRSKPSSVRLGFLACVAIDHAVDYLAFPADRSQWDGKEHRDKRARLRNEFSKESDNFRLASETANAFKHVKTVSVRGLEAGDVHERPPALAGRAMAGRSIAGDRTGAVVVDGHNLLEIATEALRFLRSKVPVRSGAERSHTARQ